MKKNGLFRKTAFILIIGGVLFGARGRIYRLFFVPQNSPEKIAGAEEAEKEYLRLIADNLTIPWEIEFLPENGILITQRPGNLLLIEAGERSVIPVDGVRHTGEGGLLGMALHPRFEENRLLYLYKTTQTGRGLVNRILRYKLTEDRTLTEKTVIVDNIPGARIHNGGRVRFGPDGYLYITTGDAAEAGLSQDRDSLAGKILRVTDEGEIPEGNPFGTEIYSYGHRNPQGLAWDDRNRLWSTEHGARANDELNLIEPGKNYGWPVIEGAETREGMEAPILYSGSRYTWAPAGAEYFNGSVFFGGLRGSALYEASINSEPALKTHFKERFGRIRLARLAPDGMLYIATSNRDGRGVPSENDDRIIGIDVSMFKQGGGNPERTR